jgi:dTDP-4-amino-4,6-dideoxygalactose transaminase
MIKLTHPTIGESEINSVVAVLKSRHLERGDVTKSLEEELKHYFKSKNAIVTANGTAALFTGLIAGGIKPGDEIITTPFSFISTVNVILLCKAKPVFVDIDKNTFNLDVSKIEEKITPKTKAILVADLYGHAADYDQLQKLAHKHNFLLISDSCQSIGSKYKRRDINHYTDITVFSFFGSKSMAAGEGGILLTNNQLIADNVNLLINHGQKRGEKYNYICPGWNFRPTDIQSALISSQLKRLKGINFKRRENAKYLIKQLSDIRGLELPLSKTNVINVYSRFTVKVASDFPLSRDELKDYLYKNGIETEISYPKPIFDYEFVKKYKNGEYPVVENIVNQVLSLPIHQNLTLDELDYIIKIIRKLVKV